MKRKNPDTTKRPSSCLVKNKKASNVILLDNPEYVCILNYSKKHVSIREKKETPVEIDYIKEVLPAIFHYKKCNKHNNRTVSCAWTPNEGYLIEFDMNTYQFVTNTIQMKCGELQTYFQLLVKRIFTSKLTKLENIFYQYYFHLNNVIEVNKGVLWSENQLPGDYKKTTLCQIPALCPILTLGIYQEIPLDKLDQQPKVVDKVKINLPVQSFFSQNFLQYIIQQNNLKKVVALSKDLISFLMYFKNGFYTKHSTTITISDFIWSDYGTISIINEDGSIVKNIDFKKLYFIQDKLNILQLMTAAINILGLFLLGKSITVQQT